MNRGLAVALVVIAGVSLRVYARPPAPVVVRRPIVAAAASPEARGRLAFERYGCRLCHGEEGKGGLANPNAQGDGKVPSVIIDYKAEGYTVAELRRLILYGKPRIDREDEKGPIPPFRMPGWKGQISDQEVDDLVRYLTSLYPRSISKKSSPTQ